MVRMDRRGMPTKFYWGNLKIPREDIIKMDVKDISCERGDWNCLKIEPRGWFVFSGVEP
jgi:hypothetical protein